MTCPRPAPLPAMACSRQGELCCKTDQGKTCSDILRDFYKYNLDLNSEHVRQLDHGGVRYSDPKSHFIFNKTTIYACDSKL